jgi:hypothetical protein
MGCAQVRAALDHSLVDVLACGESRFQHADGRQQIGDEECVDDETGPILRADDVLVEHVGNEVFREVARFRTGEQ